MNLRDMEQAATPGPWEVSPKACGHVAAGRRGIAACGGYQSNVSDETPTNEANAAFIAAARNALPELLDLLERAYRIMRQHETRIPPGGPGLMSDIQDTSLAFEQWCSDRAKVLGETE